MPLPKARPVMRPSVRKYNRSSRMGSSFRPGDRGSTGCDLFRPIYDATDVDGCLRVSPLLAYDTASTIVEPKSCIRGRATEPLHQDPGTRGLPAIERRLLRSADQRHAARELCWPLPTHAWHRRRIALVSIQCAFGGFGVHQPLGQSRDGQDAARAQGPVGHSGGQTSCLPYCLIPIVFSAWPMPVHRRNGSYGPAPASGPEALTFYITSLAARTQSTQCGGHAAGVRQPWGDWPLADGRQRRGNAGPVHRSASMSPHLPVTSNARARHLTIPGRADGITAKARPCGRRANNTVRR